MADGKTKVLHTSSSYFNGAYLKGSQERTEYFLESKLRADLNAAEDYAKRQELSFYQRFFPNVSDFNGFLAEMQKIYSGADKDGQRISRLANENVGNFLGTAGNILVEEEIKYEIIVEGDTVSIPLDGLNTKNSQVNRKTFNIDINLPDAKKVANEIRKNPEISQYLKTNSGSFKTSSSSKTNWKQWMNEELGGKILQAGETAIKTLGDSGITLKATRSGQKKTTSSTGFFRVVEELPIFSLKASDIKERLNNPEAKAQVSQQLGIAIEALKNYVFNSILDVENGCTVNGANILKEAATMAWRSTMSSKIGGDPLFFFVGGNFMNGLKGKLGEYQLSLLDRYTALATNKTNAKLGNIIGAIAKGTRGQPRSDYQVVVEVAENGEVGSIIAGVQVKNYDRSSMSSVDINSDLGLIAPNLGEGFADTLANVQFNTDIYNQSTDMETFLEKFLNKYFWKAMNLNVGENLDPMHTNTFYWAGGTSIMPASTIIRTIFNNKLITNPTFTIDNFAKPTLGDEEYLNNKKDSGSPLFTDYWVRTKGDDWEKTNDNISLYQKLLTDIKVHTRFSLLAIFNANGGMQNFQFL